MSGQNSYIIFDGIEFTREHDGALVLSSTHRNTRLVASEREKLMRWLISQNPNVSEPFLVVVTSAIMFDRVVVSDVSNDKSVLAIAISRIAQLWGARADELTKEGHPEAADEAVAIFQELSALVPPKREPHTWEDAVSDKVKDS